ncbi:hypothetical protein E8E11_002375 [Didymella keratinophila]|nr:hypothetical protein E8E11_002375 [Didymella keratinophila]
MNDRQSFRFLDLPAELRVKVYEQISSRIFMKTFGPPSDSAHKGRHPNWKLGGDSVELSYSKPSLATTATCRLIRREAISILSEDSQMLQSCLTKFDEEDTFDAFDEDATFDLWDSATQEWRHMIIVQFEKDNELYKRLPCDRKHHEDLSEGE